MPLSARLVCCMAGAAQMLCASPDARAESAGPARFEAAFTADRLQNIDGGLSRGGRSMMDIALAAQVDLGEMLNVSGLTLSGTVRYDSAGHVSERYVGDIQGVSNIDAPEAWRLYELWLEWRTGSASLGAGFYDLNSEFDVSQSASLFLNGSHGIGPEIGLSGQNGPSIFPVTGLALRFSYEFAADWTLRAAALDAVPGDPDHPSRFVDTHLSSEDGALLVGEVERALSGGSARVGLWRYSEQQERMHAAGRDTSHGVYAGVDAELTGNLRGFVRGGLSSASVNPVSRYAAVGVVHSRSLGALQDVELGIALNRAWLSDGFRSTLSEPTRPHETNVELTARITLTPQLALQPDLQWIIDPAEARGRDALVIGLRVNGALTF